MTPPPPSPSAGRPRLIWAGVAAAIAVAAYLNALPAGFVYDDADQVVANAWIRDARHVVDMFTRATWDFAGVKTNYYRPLMHLVFLAEHAAFGLWAPGFHAVNVLLHAAVTVLVLLLAARLLRPGATSARGLVLPGIAALLFAVHPLHAEVVAWVAGVPDLTATLLGLACVLLHVSCDPARPRVLAPRPLGAALCFFAALLGKETALLLPAVLVAHDLLVAPAPAPRWGWARRQVPYALAAALYLVLRLRAFGGLGAIARFEVSFPEAILNGVALAGRYAEKLAVPVDLSALYAFTPLRPGALGARDVADLLAGLAVLAAGPALLARGHRRAFLAWALGVATLLPVLYIPALGEHPFADRYAYFPSVGFVLLVALAGEAVVARRPRLAPALGGAAALAVAAGGAATLARNPVWADDLTLWRDTVARSPGSAVARFNLGVALQGEGRHAEALAEYRQAVALDPSPVALNNLGIACRELGALAEAIPALERAVALAPRYADAHSNLALAYLEAGRVDAAVAHLRTAVDLAPGVADYLNNLGTALREAGRPDEAARWYEATLRADPGHEVARRNLARLRGR